MEKSNARKVIKVILGIAIVVLLIGISYSVWNYNFSGNSNKIATGEVKLELLESAENIIQIDKGFPVLDEIGMTSDDTFDFAVTTETSMKKIIAYELYIENLNEQVLCSSLQSPSRDKNPDCYVPVLSDNEKSIIIEWMRDSQFWCNEDDSETVYNFIVNHDKEGLVNFYKNQYGMSDEEIEYIPPYEYISEFEMVGYEKSLIDSYEYDTGNIITLANYSFVGNNIDYSEHFKDSEIKVYLTDYNDNKILGPVKISELNNYRLKKKFHNHDKDNVKITDKFKLRAWIDEDVEAGDWDENTNLQYKFKIGVRAITVDRNESTLVSGTRFAEILSNDQYFDFITNTRFITEELNTSRAASGIYDVSEAQDGSILAWFEEYKPLTRAVRPQYSLIVATEYSNMYANQDCSYMFSYVHPGDLDVRNLNTSRVVNMNKMFYDACIGDLLGIENWDTSNVMDMREMFANSYSFWELNLQNWDTSKVIDAVDMFCNTSLASDDLQTGPKWTLGNEIFSCTLPEDETE